MQPEKHALYVIGEPGVGKTTLVEYLTAGHDYEETAFPFPFRYYSCRVMEIGKRRPRHSGTDALRSDVVGAVEKYLENAGPSLVLAEGDKLANGRFFAALLAAGYKLRIVALVGKEIAKERRVAQRGFRQDDTWLKSRRTKVYRLFEEWGPYCQMLDANLSPEILAGAILSPVAEAFRNGR